MAWIRQTHRKGCAGKTSCSGCGPWKATVRTPAGRVTRQHRLKGTISRWAADLEDDVRGGDFVDPRAGTITVGEWWERCQGARHLEMASRKRDESHWRNHVAPRWARVPLNAILKTDVSAWVVAMRQRKPPVGATTIEGALGVLRALLDQAIDARILRDNPARGVRRPRRDAHVDRILDADEQRQLLDRFGELCGDRVDGRLFVELILDTGESHRSQDLETRCYPVLLLPAIPGRPGSMFAQASRSGDCPASVHTEEVTGSIPVSPTSEDSPGGRSSVKIGSHGGVRTQPIRHRGELARQIVDDVHASPLRADDQPPVGQQSIRPGGRRAAHRVHLGQLGVRGQQRTGRVFARPDTGFHVVGDFAVRQAVWGHGLVLLSQHRQSDHVPSLIATPCLTSVTMSL